MGFWEGLQVASGMGHAFPWVVLGVVALATLLASGVPLARVRIRTALLIFAVALVGLFVAAVLLAAGFPQTSLTYRWIRWTSLYIQAVALIVLAGVVVFEVLLTGLRLRPPRIVRDLLLALAYLIAAITLLSNSGVNLAGIVATSAVITAVIGISLQDTLGNIMGGIILQTGHFIRVGDWIRVDQQEGRVSEISWRQTAIETQNWDTVVIPNNLLTKGQVTILGQRSGAPRQRRQFIYFNVDFRYAPTSVIDTVETALRAEPIANVAQQPAPHCIVTEFKESYLTYAARYWLTDLAATEMVDSVVRARIYFALRRAGVPLSIPAQTVFVTAEDEARRERKQDQELEQRIAALQTVEIFRPLTDDERRELAGRLRVAPFSRGEAMTRQGTQGQWLYLIHKGEADVRVSVEGAAQSRHVATLHAGDCFGEMGLMTGEPRSATVVALTDVECYRLDKGGFIDILQHRPQIAEEISHLLAQRRIELDAVREGLTEEAMRQRMQRTQGDLLYRIRKFFTLEGAN